MTPKKIFTAYDVLKTTGILKAKPDNTLSQIISKLRNSHDAVFVFDNKDKFLGVVSFANIFKHNSIKDNSRLKNICKMPPKPNISARISEIAKLMINTQIYFLPIFDNDNNFLGIVSANRLFKFVITNHLLKGKDRLIFSPRQMITIKPDESIATVWQKLQSSKNSKALALDDQGNISGIVSRYDFRHLKITGQRTARGSRIGEKTSELDQPVNGYLKKVFFTIKKIPNFSSAYEMMKENKVNSLVLVDNNNAPIDIITRRDLLNTIAENEI